VSELFIVEMRYDRTWVPSGWTNSNDRFLLRGVAIPVDRETAEKALAKAQRQYPDSKYRIAPAPPEGV